MTGRAIGKQAVVIGAGMSGLAAAGALADYFERVLILERDCLPSRPVPRPGTPQSRHLHVLLPGGQRALSDLFQNFEQDLIAAGSVPVRMFRDFRMEVPGIGTLPQRDFDWFLYCGTRPLIEMATRRQVERLTNVTIRQGCAVFKIAADPDGGMTATFAGSNETIRADLIVDASGRATRVARTDDYDAGTKSPTAVLTRSTFVVPINRDCVRFLVLAHTVASAKHLRAPNLRKV